jgi:4-aminobutyrate aminotransferase-like enzyme
MHDTDQTAAWRDQHLGCGLSLAYSQPLTMVRAEAQYMYDANGRRYLDCINNVNHVGHCHPGVVQAVAKQMAEINTNTRYLHPLLSRYVNELSALFPDPLDTVYLCNSGSEAVELALRLAKTYTGRQDVICVEAGYHGNTQGCIDVSEYKFAGPGGTGRPQTTHVAALPCSYRGEYRGAGCGVAYANTVAQQVADLEQAGRAPAAFICESMISVGGQVILPGGYLERVFQAVRGAGGVCIADEVQAGFGRAGETFWGFELQNVVPDIITLGKPIGNGHPMAAVITTRQISEAFDNGMEYFNTFGGNPVSCAIGCAVLDVIEEEKLMKNALETGQYFMEALHQLKNKFELIGDVRGLGLFIGVELVKDRESKKPATEKMAWLIEYFKQNAIIMSSEGPGYNVLKIKPPIVFSKENVDRFIHIFKQGLVELAKN